VIKLHVTFLVVIHVMFRVIFDVIFYLILWDILWNSIFCVWNGVRAVKRWSRMKTHLEKSPAFPPEKSHTRVRTLDVAREACCSVMRCDAVCCSAVQCVAVWCSALQCGAMCCGVM